MTVYFAGLDGPVRDRLARFAQEKGFSATDLKDLADAPESFSSDDRLIVPLSLNAQAERLLSEHGAPRGFELLVVTPPGIDPTAPASKRFRITYLPEDAALNLTEL